MPIAADNQVLVEEALRGYPSDPKYRDPFKVWAEKAISSGTLPDDAITCTDIGVKREIATSLAAKGTSTTASVLTTTGAIATTGLAAATLGIGAAVAGILTAIFSKHKQKVKEERQILCTAVPAAQEMLSQTDAKVSSHEWTALEGGASLDALENQWRIDVQPILKDDGKACNAACGYTRVLHEVIIKKKRDYPLLEKQGAATIGIAVGAVAVVSAIVILRRIA